MKIKGSQTPRRFELSNILVDTWGKFNFMKALFLDISQTKVM